MEIVKNNPITNYVKYLIKYAIPYRIFGERLYGNLSVKIRFYRSFRRKLDINNPITLNEKIQWLKLHDHKDYYTKCADKYEAREIWKRFGEEGLIPLLYHTTNWRDIVVDNIPYEPCIVKSNTGSAAYVIVRDREDVNISLLQKKCKYWLKENAYYKSQEWQYKNIKPRIIIEKLLLDERGHIPNDYKLFFINGELQFVYCSIDREGENYRSIYSPDWERMDIEWVPSSEHRGYSGKDITAPRSFNRMKEIAKQIAQDFPCVRIDFYDLDGKLYYGEITLYHGSGFDTFVPEKYDEIFGNKLKL